MIPRNSAVLLAVFCASCASATYYAPTEPSPLTPRSVPGMTYDIPAAHGHGELRIAALGMRRLPSVSGHPVFVVRYYIDNKSGADWGIDLQDQLLSLGDTGERQAPIASGLDAAKSAFNAQAGKTQVFDLVYDSPAGEPRVFSLDWKLRIEGKPQDGHVIFERTPIPPSGMQGYNGVPVIINGKRALRGNP